MGTKNPRSYDLGFFCLFLALEELHFTFMLFRGFQTVKGAKVFAFACLGVLLF